MVELTVDGNTVEVPEGSMVMHAAQKVGLYVPHFCYHKKLSIAANCRMCLVEVEKAPKALPACATPVTNGMVVHTCSEKARAAQKSVMEFLLINHPLDCPICDQGGECQLQDLAVGYGGSSSRYQEEKRVVFHKDLGPLVSAEEMSRCIHCTRCVRFGQEIAGVMELGMLGRGEHSEITSFVGRSIESELSGNMIDICPVGALTSKPFRYSARTWELARRRSVSPHDSLGANLVVQVKGDRVMRVVPFEDEAVNECWISDRDRFSYEGLNSEDRLSAPMIKGADGKWQEASWADALAAVAQGLSRVRDSFGAGQIGALASEYATTEEYALLGRLVRALGSENIDFRLRQTDAAFDAALTGAPWLGMPIAELDNLDRVLVVGSFLRKDHPLMAQRLRQAAKRGTQILMVDSAADDPLMPVAGRLTVAPSELPRALAEVAVALAQAKEAAVPAEFASVTPGENAKIIAASLASGSNTAVLMGNLAVASAQASTLAANGRAVADLAGGKFGFLTSGGNTVGGYLAGAIPGKGGKNAAAMLAEPLKAYVVLHAEPLLDADNGQQAIAALRGAQFAVALTPYRSAAAEWADVMLPVAPFTETSGTFVNAQGLAQSFKGTVAPFGQTRPAWKVLRVLGNVLHLAGFDDETSESVRDTALAGGVEGRLSNDIKAPLGLGQALTGLERVADVPIYRTDAMVRRSEPLQAAPASKLPAARMNGNTLTSLGLTAGVKVRVTGGQGAVELETVQDDAVADRAVRIAAAFENTAALGGAFGQLSVERA
ncbi:MAG: NADH-quinone oxidoreductase subunit G [Achromobacter sp.]|jgi:NADH-quinone oxidoreductase subunit G|uniref:NADH-quinone oxidoreductase n=1 Tax=Achromobacter insuavis TaxID=1287735 RepID=A0A6J4ZHT7_9BURK|nr:MULTISPECIES: NADH-quinone oxidoreductase subunit NuoG [Achromobacter]MBN9640130.1 NADH-quinone oxidoreductase subunit G [Achromobacter sp.]CAB3624007.1 NADH-quinone oxidoreductase chain 3 [Achromobacter insuavis]CAB3820612.1 NADH-quinone oxidoreductase chain 3 [Achromobacter insuavis]CUI38817.1 NADH-quinone oxidoreductase chain 3 [Achromobacter sp. 2789STDY5608621]CUI75724.1 NADH-quinone oxidoreductase chain 3 [Achromobacter sp. 2789STDY5608633]